ncbi:hypothetical protein OROMI_012330 [Orobanche minor]
MEIGPDEELKGEGFVSSPVDGFMEFPVWVSTVDESCLRHVSVFAAVVAAFKIMLCHDKFSGNKCFHIAPKQPSIGEPRGWDWHDSEPSRYCKRERSQDFFLRGIKRTVGTTNTILFKKIEGMP